MKKFKILGLITSLIMIFCGCEELPDPAGVRGVGIVPGIENLNPGIYDSKNLATTYVEFTVSIPEGTSADKVTIVGFYNEINAETAITEVTSFPSVVRILASDAAQKMGIALADIVNGDIFTFVLCPTVNGKTYHSSAVLSVPIACAYDVALATGSYHSVSADWASEGNITLTADPDDPYKIYVTGLEEMEGLVEDLGPLVMYINPATFNVSVPEKAIASEAWGYGAISYSGTGVYSSCDGSYSMDFNISLASLGSLGIYGFTFTRNP
jgi:hypothetical protein